MNLISCDNCGLVYDKDKVPFPTSAYSTSTMSVDHSKATWHNREYHFFVTCSCGAPLIGDII